MSNISEITNSSRSQKHNSDGITSIGSDSISLNAIKRMNTVEKKQFTNCVMDRHHKIQKYLAKKLANVDRVHEKLKNELVHFNDEKNKYDNAMNAIKEASKAIRQEEIKKLEKLGFKFDKEGREIKQIQLLTNQRNEERIKEQEEREKRREERFQKEKEKKARISQMVNEKNRLRSMGIKMMTP
jgi:hypothetical protein